MALMRNTPESHFHIVGVWPATGLHHDSELKQQCELQQERKKKRTEHLCVQPKLSVMSDVYFSLNQWTVCVYRFNITGLKLMCVCVYTVWVLMLWAAMMSGIMSYEFPLVKCNTNSFITN